MKQGGKEEALHYCFTPGIFILHMRADRPLARSVVVCVFEVSRVEKKESVFV